MSSIKKAGMLTLVAAMLFAVAPLVAESTVELTTKEAAADNKEKEEKKKKSKPKLSVGYDDGLKFKTDDGRFSAKLNFRAQLRAVDLNSSDLPLEPDGIEPESGGQIRRPARPWETR